MRIGVSVMYWPWFELDEQIALAEQADRLGFASVWVAESWGQDAVAMLGAIAMRTERIGLGAGVMQIPARQPTSAAMAATTLDGISRGRFRLGLGLSGPQVSEGWYGVPFTAPLARTREYVEIVREALSGRPVDYAGTQWSIPVRDAGMGLGKPLKLLGKPAIDRVPIYLAVTGPKTVEQAGRIADGWLPFLYSPQSAAMMSEPLLRGIEAAGRRRADVRVAPMVPTAVDADLDEARALVRPFVAFYLGAMGARDKNFYVELADRLGHGASARACQDRFLAGDRRGAAAELTDDLVDLAGLAATPATLEKRLAEYEAAGVDELIVVPFGDRPGILRALAPHLAHSATA
jgi:F420-dependent oxidoreductase-like protein